MDEDALLRQLQTQKTNNDIRRTLQLAKVRCLSFDALLKRLGKIAEDDHPLAVVYVVLETQRDSAQNSAVAEIMRKLLEDADRFPSKKKEWMDRQIGRIMRTLPSRLSHPLAIECLRHNRKSRRTIGFRSLPRDVIWPESTAFFLDRHAETNDERFLKALIRYPLDLKIVDPVYLLEQFAEDEYSRMLVLEATLRSNRQAGIALAPNDLSAFVWASGRIGDTGLTPLITRFFYNTNDKLAVAGIVAWAYGRLHATKELIELEALIDDLAGTD